MEEEIVFYDQQGLIDMLKVVAPKKLFGKRHKMAGYHSGVHKCNFENEGFHGSFQSFLFKDCVFTKCRLKIYGVFTCISKTVNLMTAGSKGHGFHMGNSVGQVLSSINAFFEMLKLMRGTWTTRG